MGTRRRRSCKHGKLKRPVKTKSGGKRRCRKVSRKRRSKKGKRRSKKGKRRSRKRRSRKRRKYKAVGFGGAGQMGGIVPVVPMSPYNISPSVSSIASQGPQDLQFSRLGDYLNNSGFTNSEGSKFADHVLETNPDLDAGLFSEFLDSEKLVQEIADSGESINQSLNKLNNLRQLARQTKDQEPESTFVMNKLINAQDLFLHQ